MMTILRPWRLLAVILSLALVGCNETVPVTPEVERPANDAQPQSAEGSGHDSEAAAILAANETFPFDFALTDVNGQPIELADYQGKVVIVDIWGTWCPPCRKEIPSFIKLQETYGPKGFQMVGLNDEGERSEEAAQLVRDYMAEVKINYPCALIDEGTKSQVPNFQGYPTTLFIDRTGKVRAKVVGLHEYEFLESLVTALLDEPAAGAPATGG